MYYFANRNAVREYKIRYGDIYYAADNEWMIGK